MRRLVLFVVVLALLAPLSAQRGGFGQFGGFRLSNPPGPDRYDGRFTLARLYYGRYPGWSYDWPDMEHHLGQILNSISSVRAHHERNTIIRMDDPELMKYPVSYLSEPGYWYPTDKEVEGLRTYLHKGGFLIVDDFHFPEEWAVFEIAMHKVLPGAIIEPLQLGNPIFNSFFPIKSLHVPYPGRLGEMGLYGEFFGIRDLEDPSNRLMVVIDYNIDLGDYIEYTPGTFYAVAPTNEAYKFVINYLVYGLTH